MAAPAMSHVICSMALIVLILVLPAFFTMQRDRFAEEMAIRELTEISDYTSNTLENLFILANSTNAQGITITKELIYLPMKVEGSPYVLSIASDDGENVSQVVASLTDKPWIIGSSWIIPGLKITSNNSLTIGETTVQAGCRRTGTGFYVWLEEDE
jgi:hypothetical protein